MGALAQLVPSLLQRHRVRGVVGWLKPCERAEETARDTDIGGLEAQVVVEVGPGAVTLLARAVGEPPDRQQIRRREQPDAIFEAEPLAGAQLVIDV